MKDNNTKPVLTIQLYATICKCGQIFSLTQRVQKTEAGGRKENRTNYNRTNTNQNKY